MIRVRVIGDHVLAIAAVHVLASDQTLVAQLLGAGRAELALFALPYHQAIDKPHFEIADLNASETKDSRKTDDPSHSAPDRCRRNLAVQRIRVAREGVPALTRYR